MRQYIKDFVIFGIKQAYACLFGGLLLSLIIITKLLWKPEYSMARYDALFLAAVLIQVILVVTRLETLEECKVIIVFHIIGTIMEVFKTHIGSWQYPEENMIRIAGVPLFSGFMYSSVGSYIARVWRIFAFKFQNFPDKRFMAVLCALIYLNFFTHHYLYDMRYFLFGLTGLIFFKTHVYFKPNKTYYHMPLLLGFFLVAFFIWIAENMGTFGTIWVYPNQQELWHIVSPSKMGAWFLLMIISFVLVSLLHKEDNTANYIQ
jgi:uncharacterized membrane protein YoaT (DUF817 family)